MYVRCMHACMYICMRTLHVQNKMTEMTDYDERRAYVAASQRPRARERTRAGEYSSWSCVCWVFGRREKKCAVDCQLVVKLRK